MKQIPLPMPEGHVRQRQRALLTHDRAIPTLVHVPDKGAVPTDAMQAAIRAVEIARRHLATETAKLERLVAEVRGDGTI